MKTEPMTAPASPLSKLEARLNATPQGLTLKTVVVSESIAPATTYRPINEDDAATLRPFVSAADLIEIDRECAAASKRYDTAHTAYQAAQAEIKRLKQVIADARRAEKVAKATVARYFNEAFWAKLDDLRDRAWSMARDARLKASDEGQPLKRETAEECKARVNAAKATPAA